MEQRYSQVKRKEVQKNEETDALMKELMCVLRRNYNERFLRKVLTRVLILERMK